MEFRLCLLAYVSIRCCLCLNISGSSAADSQRSAVVDSDNGLFMLVSGASSSEELCLGESDEVPVLEECSAAIAAGGGRDLWRLLPGGQLMNVAEEKCLDISTTESENAFASLQECDFAPTWEFQEHGTLKRNTDGDTCLSLYGEGSGEVDLALNTAIVASSTLHRSHGSQMAVDGSGSSYWASEFDPEDIVSITLDLGERAQPRSLVIDWEFPATAFTVSFSSDATRWQERFSTDSNVLNTTVIRLDSSNVRRLLLVMRKPHSVYGRFDGHLLYGIRSLRLLGGGLRPSAVSCGQAAKSKDARDKWFKTFVAQVDAGPHRLLTSAVPVLRASMASLSAITSELSELLAQTLSCGGNAMFTRVTRTGVNVRRTSAVESQNARYLLSSQLVRFVEVQQRIELRDAIALIAEARAKIMEAQLWTR